MEPLSLSSWRAPPPRWAAERGPKVPPEPGPRSLPEGVPDEGQLGVLPVRVRAVRLQGHVLPLPLHRVEVLLLLRLLVRGPGRAGVRLAHGALVAAGEAVLHAQQ